MSQIVMRRCASRLLIVLPLLLLLTGCPKREGTPPPGPQPLSDNFCDKGNSSKNQPFICVDHNTLMADPALANAWDKEKGPDGRPSNKPVKIRWNAKQTINLEIEFKDESCVVKKKPDCDGEGACVVKIKDIDWAAVPDPDGDGKKYLVCKYDLKLGGTLIDPEAEMSVNPCCW